MRHLEGFEHSLVFIGYVGCWLLAFFMKAPEFLYVGGSAIACFYLIQRMVGKEGLWKADSAFTQMKRNFTIMSVIHNSFTIVYGIYILTVR